MIDKLKNWINEQIRKIQESNDKPFKTKIIELTNFISRLKSENVSLVNNILELNVENSELEDALVVFNKHSSLSNYKDWLDNNVTVKTRYYNFGSGRKQVHKIFEESLKDEEIIRDFTKTNLEFDGSKYDTPDKLVYWFNRKLSNKYPTHKYYRYDKDLYGQTEYWATAKKTIENMRNKNVLGDCDDSMILRYSCLYYLLKDFFPKDIWRLRGFIVDLWTSGGHALLAWIKEGVNDWIPLETTFYDDKQGIIWNKNYKIRNQLLYRIIYSFDNNYEYMKI